MTGREKLKPSSATSGGGGGTGSDRRNMASAASSNAASPEPRTIALDRMCPLPVEHETHDDLGMTGLPLGRIALVFVEMGDEFLRDPQGTLSPAAVGFQSPRPPGRQSRLKKLSTIPE